MIISLELISDGVFSLITNMVQKNSAIEQYPLAGYFWQGKRNKDRSFRTKKTSFSLLFILLVLYHQIQVFLFGEPCLSFKIRLTQYNLAFSTFNSMCTCVVNLREAYLRFHKTKLYIIYCVDTLHLKRQLRNCS